ncbi:MULTISPECIES: hypothetical protein [Nocardiaceae]|uniref:hypothetical protein n=1 Tax=Nocardiaceae TaxID=85025 RepID=UPI001179EFEB|nr:MULTISPECIES: hypothetical protein [Rhodococcus]
MIHPKFFESHPLAEIEDVCALVTFQGIWVFGDDRGRIEDDADVIWMKVWPLRRDQVRADDVRCHIDALVDGEQLCRYVIGGGRFLHVISWDEHQSINHPTPSKLPPCPTHQPAEYAMWWKDDDTATNRWRKREKAAQGDKGDPVVTTVVAPVVTTSQCSSVQINSVQGANPAKPNLKQLNPKKPKESKPTFIRPSQRGAI